MTRWGATLMTLGLATACGTDSGRAEPGGPALTLGGSEATQGGPTGPTSADVSTGEDSDETGSSGTGEVDTHSGPTFDVGTNDPSGGVPLGCDKVDFVFIVDNSSSMDDDQANLIENFPVFAAGIESALAHVEDIHVGVVTTDAYSAMAPPCNRLGTLVTRTSGAASSMADCGPFAEGNAFMTAADDLAAGFACAARVGIDGLPREQPIEAMMNVARKIYDEPGGCNEGFIRDDALFVAVLITDEVDGPEDHETMASPGTPSQWRDELTKLKGHPQNTAIVSLVKGDELGCPPAEGESAGGSIVNFTNLFGSNGLVGGICQDHGEVFTQAVEVIERACEGYVPPG